MNLKRFHSATTRPLLLIILCSIFAKNTRAQQQVLWKFPTNAAIHSSAIISANLIYFGSADSSLYALDKNTGKLKWKFKTNGKIHSSPAIHHNKVVFSSADGKIYALNKDNGQITWTFQTNGEKVYDIWDYYISSPVINNNTVYIGSGDHHIYAINASTGKKLWAYQTNGIVHATPIVKDTVVYTGSYDGNLYALQSTTGKLIWKFKTVGDVSFPKGEIQKAAIIHNNAIIFGSRDYNIYSLNLKTGTGNWNMKERGSWIIASPLLYKNNIYFGTSDTHRFYSMNAETGEIKWTLPLNMRVYGTAISINDQIAFGCFNGKIYFVDPESGKVKSTFQTEESKKTYASIFDEQDHLRKEIDLYGADYIKTEHSILALGAILGSPLVENQMLYFGDTNGFFYALKKLE
ncbi:PQQ-binding-like beta-propeller repeat protein [Pedobacter nyackensis]|uniref:outer membrane protein assembly factor BamB family protein n=1 Tax=Pedobacter nyackensis TaxID=475255 RepID=UPI002930A755|nr:PQQ-binding-like beta-propeller repeat protein [Pedobacter nyackensis]